MLIFICENKNYISYDYDLKNTMPDDDDEILVLHTSYFKICNYYKDELINYLIKNRLFEIVNYNLKYLIKHYINFEEALEILFNYNPYLFMKNLEYCYNGNSELFKMIILNGEIIENNELSNEINEISNSETNEISTIKDKLCELIFKSSENTKIEMPQWARIFGNISDNDICRLYLLFNEIFDENKDNNKQSLCDGIYSKHLKYINYIIKNNGYVHICKNSSDIIEIDFSGNTIEDLKDMKNIDDEFDNYDF
jgi:hypothetical protein